MHVLNLEPRVLKSVKFFPCFFCWALLELAYFVKPRWNNIWTLTGVFPTKCGRAKIHDSQALNGVGRIHVIVDIFQHFKNIPGIRIARHIRRRLANLESHRTILIHMYMEVMMNMTHFLCKS